MDLVELTKDGLEKLQAEYDELVNKIKPEVTEQLVTARSYGDLSENADFDAARNRQAQVEGRIKELENILHNHKIIDSKGSSDSVTMGSVVTVDNKGKTVKYKIVGTVEVNPLDEKEDFRSISNESPVGKALYKHKVGETVKVECKNPYTLTIKKIEGNK